jgi:CheY-like chemotaxis protein
MEDPVVIMNDQAQRCLRVLVVDDEPFMLKLCERMLKQLGAESVVVETGREGLERIREKQGPFDLLIFDIVLADTTGLDLYRETRKVLADVPILFMSGFPKQQGLAETLEADPRSRFLAKPFSIDDMRDTLDSLIA